MRDEIDMMSDELDELIRSEARGDRVRVAAIAREIISTATSLIEVAESASESRAA